jgi:hypothetical protein
MIPGMDNWIIWSPNMANHKGSQAAQGDVHRYMGMG